MGSETDATETNLRRTVLRLHATEKGSPTHDVIHSNSSIQGLQDIRASGKRSQNPPTLAKLGYFY